MNKKVAIVSDSSACLTDEMIKNYDLYVNYLYVIFGNESYKEFKDITPERFLQLAAAQKELPSTSQAAPGLTLELYEEIFAKGYEEIIHITISTGISGSYQSSLTAAGMVEKGTVHVFDSKTVSYAQAALAIEASKLASTGKSAAEIIPVLEKLQTESHSMATVKTLENLNKGGRLSNAQAFIGSMLQVKPIIEMTPEGKLEACGKVRTFKKAIDALASSVAEQKLDESYEIAVMHVDNDEEATLLQNKIREVYPNATFHTVPFPLVVAVHVGAGALGVSWAKKAS